MPLTARALLFLVVKKKTNICGDVQTSDTDGPSGREVNRVYEWNLQNENCASFYSTFLFLQSSIRVMKYTYMYFKFSNLKNTNQKSHILATNI